MNKSLKPVTLIAALIIGTAASAGSDVFLDVYGNGGQYDLSDFGNGRTIVDAYGDYQDVDISKFGNGTLDTFLSGTGANLQINDRSRSGTNKVYGGICPPGGKTRSLDLTHGGGIHILRCD